jgi:hypothetical protein
VIGRLSALNMDGQAVVSQDACLDLAQHSFSKQEGAACRVLELCSRSLVQAREFHPIFSIEGRFFVQ